MSLSKQFDQMDVEFYKWLHEDEENRFKNPADAVYALIEELFEGQHFNEATATQALKYLAKLHNVDTSDVDFNSPTVVCWSEKNRIAKDRDSKISDLKKFIARHVQSIKEQIYGTEEVDASALDMAICNLAWAADQSNDHVRKINIKRS